MTNEKAVAEYDYKPDGMRLSKTVNDVKTTHIWDGANIVMDLNGDSSVRDTYTRGIGLIKSDVYGYYVFDAHGDVKALTDDFGVVTKQYDYDAFGVEIGKDLNDMNPWRYCGEYWDVETDTLYLRNRSYNPSNGRFTSEDPIRAGLNFYTYCNGNPLKYVDPWGLDYIVWDVGNGSRVYAYDDGTFLRIDPEDTHVMLKYSVEKNGGSVTFKPDTGTVEATIGDISANYHGEIINGRMIVPAKQLAHDFGMDEDDFIHKSGDSFNSADDAALAWALTYVNIVFKEDREYGACIYKKNGAEIYTFGILVAGPPVGITGELPIWDAT